MLLRRFTDFILQGRLNAMAVAFLLSFIPVIGASVSILVATFITLRKSVLEGALVLAASIIPFFIMYAGAQVSEKQLLIVGMGTIITINVLTWLLALVLQRFANWSLVIEIALIAGIVLVCGIHLVYPHIQDWWSVQLTAYFNRTASLLTEIMPAASTSTEKISADMIANMKRYMTGFIVAAIMFNALLQLAIARWWQAVMFNPGGLQKELHHIRLSYLTVILFIIVSIMAYLGSVIGMDLMPVLIAAVAGAGLSLIHRVALANKNGWLILIVVYLGILFVFPLGILLVAMVGLFDSLLDLRKRLRK